MARTVALNLALNGVAGVVSGLGRVGEAGKAAGDKVRQNLGSSLDRLEKSAPSLSTLGSSLLKVGALAAGGLAAAGKAAIDWESSWAGVTKTVSGSEAQLGALEGQLRQMAKTLPASHKEIAAVAEAAGQLGVKTADVASFTRVMIDLGETTNLTSDEAATSLAQLMNVMQTAGGDVGRLGATVVALGNAGASTERDIVSMAQRIAGAGRQVGLSEAQVLAYASALSSVGIEAEAGGTAISQAMLKMDRMVREGGGSLELLAKTSGMSAEAFKQAWQTDAAGALNVFLKGLGNAGQSGRDVTAVLRELGITGMRESDALRRLAASGTVLSDALDLSGKAWSESSALAQEALKRYETSASKMQVAWNSITDSAITAGGQLLPVVAQIAQGAVEAANAFASLPGPVQRGSVALLGVVAVGGTVTGSLLKMAASAVEMRSTWSALATDAPRLAGVLRGFGAVGAVAAAAFVALQVAQAAWEADAKRQIRTASELAASMGKVGSSLTALSADVNQSFNLRHVDGEIRGVAAAFDVLDSQRNMDPIIGAFQGLSDWSRGSASALAMVKTQLGEYDKTMSAFSSSGESAAAAKAFNAIVAASGRTAAEVAPYMAQYRRSLESQAEALGVLSKVSGPEYVEWMAGKVPEAVKAAQAAQQGANATTRDAVSALEQQKLKLDELVSSMFAASQVALQLSGSEIGMEAAFDAATEAAKKNGKTLDTNTAAGRDNKRALDAIAASSQAYIDGLIKSGAETSTVVAVTQRARDEFVAAATAMTGSGKAAEALADKYGLIPKDVKTTITAPGASEARKSVEDLKASMSGLKPNVQTYIQTVLNTQGLDAAYAALRAIQGKTAEVFVRTVYQTSSPNVTYTPAAGGMLHGFANGGFTGRRIGSSERHIAEIAPPGAWRLWAEPETGGEAYIPLAREKWPRSRQIWMETGRRLGMIPFADGAVVTPTPVVNVASSPSVSAEGLATAVAAGLNGARLRLGPIDPITREVSAQLVTAVRRGV